jgi:hypothetical protein
MIAERMAILAIAVMEMRSNHFSFETREQRESAQFIAITCWTFGPDPDPTYDPDNGWKLDQFAMALVPDLVREYKRICRAEYPSPFPTEPFAPSLEKLEMRGKLSGEIRRHLLNARFEVRGSQFGSYAPPKVIRKALLESMKPVIETSELLELDVPYETARKFDHVRVFRLKAGPGAERQYDWPTMARQLEREGVVYPTNAKLVRYCRENVLLVSGKKPDPLPDDATARAAITKYGLWKFSKEQGKGRGKKLPG